MTFTHSGVAGNEEVAKQPGAGTSTSRDLFAGPGEMAARCRALDWEQTDLGPVSGWSHSLRTMVSAILESHHPMLLWWGPGLVQIFNDGYRPSFGTDGRDVAALGAPGHDHWAAVWDVIGPQIRQVMSTGEATWHEDQLVPIERNGCVEEAWWTYGYSPVRDDDGTIAGVLAVVQETTTRVHALVDAQAARVEAETERARLYGLFQLAPATIAVLRGPEFVIELANEEYYQLVGRRNIIGKPVFDALPEVRGQGFEELLRSVFETGESVVAREAPLTIKRTVSGPPEQRYVTFVYAPLTGADGTRSGVFAHGIDVTDQVLARRELEVANEQLQEHAAELEMQAAELEATATELEEQSDEANNARIAAERAEQELRTLANAIPTLAWTARADGYIDWYNARWYEYTGTTPEQMEGWGWQVVHDPATLPKVLDQWRASVDSGVGFEMTFPLKGADGEFRAFLTRVVPLNDADGKVIRWFGSTADVESERAARIAAETARTEAEASETRYRTLMEVLPVQVWTATPDGGLDYVGDQTCEYFGTRSDDLLGAGWARFVHPDDTDRATRRWARALTTGAPYEAEFRLLRNDGDYRWHIARALPTRSPWGEITGWIGSNTDVEDERRARAEAEEAGMAAERANRAKSDFLAVMSHELRTPLNAIGGYTELLALGIRGPVTEAQLEDLARIQRSQQHLLGLINDLLNMAQLDSGQLLYEITDVPVNATLLQVEELILPQLKAKGLNYEHASCDPAISVHADSEKLRQVVVNLLSNATKYTDTGCVSVWCDTVGATVRIHVGDTGPGIAPHQLGRIFEPFVQISGGSIRPREGVGLGLAISRDLARGMGGELRAESTSGTGSTFTLVLQRAGRAAETSDKVDGVNV